MVSQFSDPVYSSKPIRTYCQHVYDDKYASFTVKNMFESFFNKHYRKFQLIFSLNKKTVMNNHDCSQ